MTLEALVKKYARDVAFVAEEKPAKDLPVFARQLYTAWNHLKGAGIHGADELPYVARDLMDAHEATNVDPAAARELQKRAEKGLRTLPDMVDDYRLMA